MANIDQALLLLHSDDVAKRKQAILLLAKSENREALQPLLWAGKNDPDAELRNLALRSARYVKQQVEEQEVFDADEGYDFLEEPVVARGPGVSAEDERRAAQLVQQAMDLHIDGDDQTALKVLVQALDTDPGVADEATVRNMASNMIDLPPDEAVFALTRPNQRKLYIFDEGEDEEDLPTWGTVVLDIGIYTVVSVFGFVALLLMVFVRFLPLVREGLQEISRLPEVQTPEFAESLQIIEQYLQTLENNFAAVVVVSAFGTALQSILLTFLLTLSIHFVASNVLNGRGTIPQTMTQLIPLQTWFTVISYVGLVAALFLLPTSIAGFQERSGWIFALSVYGIGMLALIIAYPLLQSSFVGRVHRFGFGQGCLAVFIGSLMYSVVSSILGYAYQLAAALFSIPLS